MRIKPRQQLLELWRAVVTYRSADAWLGGGREDSNSISDAEQLLCLLYPATEIDAFALDQPDRVAPDVHRALEPWGDSTEAGGLLVGLLEEYFQRYTDPDGEPVFSAGSYFRAADGHPTDAQLALDVVDSYSMSLSLCIAALRFLRGLEGALAGELRQSDRDVYERIGPLRAKTSARLTAAMTGLVRSFVINTPASADDAHGEILRMVSQNRSPSETLPRLTRELERLRVRASNEVEFGQLSGVDVADDRRLFECGWGWGIVRTAAEVDIVPTRLGSAPGHAAPRPYLYFTAVALDGISDLSSQRIRELELLNDEQRALGDALQLRFELARTYWSTVARFGGGRWPLEDIPWRTSDGQESDYYSLVVTAILIQDLVYRDSTDDLARTVAVFDQLARRGRITSRATTADPALALHHPGVLMELAGSDIDGGSLLHWYVSDYATMLLKRCLQASRLRTDVRTRDQLMSLAEAAMEHLTARMKRGGAAAGLWDEPDPAVAGGDSGVSWFITERMMECLVVAHNTFETDPLAPGTMVNRAVDLISEAEHLLNREELRIEGYQLSHSEREVGRIRQKLDRARDILTEQPATAHSLAAEALVALDDLAYARRQATR
ncbi:SCO2524 family protein [Nocardia asteroides]|uniref:SCO2524 family protein n=1 Tax=Nocardia asteroides TaxID=1824 RepID=UPI001E4FA7C9|nr:SCO2524 family protein [Nocardia asteroides]UGT61136.1 SCO2524 family protein [Nocardia asteroides]